MSVPFADRRAGNYKLVKRFRREEEGLPTEQEGTLSKKNCVYWLKTLLLYVIMYALLALMIAINFTVFKLFLSEDTPSVLIKQPGLGFQPCILEEDSKHDYNSIYWNRSQEDDVNALKDKILGSLEKFGNRTDFGICTKNNSYGYATGKPCIFLKVNRVIGYKVDPITNSSDLPKRAKELQPYIDSLSAGDRERLWIYCRSPVKSTKFAYYPDPSIPIWSLNHEKKLTHKSPDNFYSEADYERIVVVEVSNLAIDQPVPVRCYMFAKNIIIGDKKDSGVGWIRIVFKLSE